MTPAELAALPVGEYAFPGQLRDRLVAAILAGEKTSTTSLWEQLRRGGEALWQPGYREVVVDSDGRPVCVTETVSVEVRRLGDVDDEHAHAEGEGYADATAWRAGHEDFWRSPEFVAALGDPPVTVDDDTLVVCDSFRVVERL